MCKERESQAKVSVRLALQLCVFVFSLLPFITANNLWMEFSRTYATKETTSRLQAALCWGLTI